MLLRRQADRARGMALLITLGFIVLLTILVVSYLATMRLDRMSSQNYSQAARSQELAAGAIQEILDDLRQEIDAGSLDDAAFTANGIRIFQPVSARTSQPARIGFSNSSYALDVDSDKLPPTLEPIAKVSAGR